MANKKGDVLLLVGTKKGAFVLSSDSSRKKWSLSGPHCTGGEVFHMAYDPRDGGTILTGVNTFWFGPEIQTSRDGGQTWTNPTEQPRFSAENGETVKRIWHIEPGRPSEPGVLYAGVEPAALFKTEDGGETWHEVAGLTSHPTRDKWAPGNGGLCLHSMVLDPNSNDKMWVGISAVGVFQTSDGGQNWKTRNKGVRADFQPEKFPEFGQCVHKMLMPRNNSAILYQQNHCGVYRSEDGGGSWKDISEGLPSRFGFVLGLHSNDPDTLYVLPEDKALDERVGGEYRWVTDAKFRVFRSRNRGEDWEPLTKGLPQKNAYLHAMREGMATDTLDPCGIYVGTTAGQVFHSRDDGDTWELLIDKLPQINSVDIGMVA